MLYDKRWDEKKTTEVKPTLDGFIAWLKTMDPKKTFNYQDCRGSCAVDQYLAAIGIYELTNMNFSSCPETRFLDSLAASASFVNWTDVHPADYVSKLGTFGYLLEIASTPRAREAWVAMIYHKEKWDELLSTVSD